MSALRAASAFLLSVHAVGMAGLSFLGSLSPAVLLVVLIAALLGLSGAGPATERPRRDRAATYRVGSLWSLFVLYVMAALMLVTSGDRHLASVLVGVLVGVQLVFLAWPAIGPRAVPLLVNALALCVLAGASGGYFPLLAVAGYAPLAAALIVIDHHDLRQARPSSALLPAAGHAGLAALVVWPALPWLPQATLPGGGGGPVAEGPSLSELAGSTFELLAWGALGVGAILFARWLLQRLRGEDEQTPVETVEPTAEAGAAQELGSGLPPLTLDLSGARGAIIRTFEDFLARAGKLGFSRRPNWTAAEFARRLPIPASRLARAFGRARYSIEALAESDAAAAEADAAAVLERLRDA